jgi:hypothetical protein
VLLNASSRPRSKAADLFQDDEEQMMEFVVEHDLGLTRAVMLGRQGKYGEAVKQYLDENQQSEALDLALEHIDEVTRDTNVFNAIVEKFLWRHLSFGCRGWPESTDIPFHDIDALFRRIPGKNLSDENRKMVCGSYSFFMRETTADLRGAALHFQTHLSEPEVDGRPEDPFQPCASLRESR